jgi:hypothetical protein
MPLAAEIVKVSMEHSHRRLVHAESRWQAAQKERFGRLGRRQFPGGNSARGKILAAVATVNACYSMAALWLPECIIWDVIASSEIPAGPGASPTLASGSATRSAAGKAAIAPGRGFGSLLDGYMTDGWKPTPVAQRPTAGSRFGKEQSAAPAGLPVESATAASVSSSWGLGPGAMDHSWRVPIHSRPGSRCRGHPSGRERLELSSGAGPSTRGYGDSGPIEGFTRR